MKKLVPAILILSLFVGCEVEDDHSLDNQDVYQAYRFEFDQSKNVTAIGAMFKDGSEKGPVIQLVNPAFVKVNDANTAYKHADEYPYTFIFASRLPEAKIEFMDSKRQLFTNTISLSYLVPVGDIIPVVDPSTGQLDVAFSGQEQGIEELITLVVSTVSDEASFISYTAGAKSIIVVPENLLRFKGQLVTLKVVREKYIDLQHVSDSGGELLLVYTSAEVAIQL